MDDFVDVQIFKGTDDLDQVILNLHFCESFSAFDQLVQSMVRTDFQKNVNVLMVLENVLELYNVVVVQGFVDLDFGDKLWL